MDLESILDEELFPPGVKSGALTLRLWLRWKEEEEAQPCFSWRTEDNFLASVQASFPFHPIPTSSWASFCL